MADNQLAHGLRSEGSYDPLLGLKAFGETP